MSVTILKALARQEIEVVNLLLKDSKSCNVVTSSVVVIMEVDFEMHESPSLWK